MKRLFGLVIFGASICFGASANDNLRLFSAEDVFELEWADDPQIAPDGLKALYVRRFNDVMTDRTHSHVWLINLDGSNHQPLLADAGSYSSPRWSPDGARIAYLKRGPKRTELCVLYLKSGREALLGAFEEAPRDLTWSPNGNSIAFSMAVKGESENLVSKPKIPEGANWAAPPKVVDRARYRTNSEGFMDLAYDHIFIVPADGGTERQLTSGDFHHNGTLSFTPDGSEILFSANRHSDWELETREADIFSVNVSTGESHSAYGFSGCRSEPKNIARWAAYCLPPDWQCATAFCCDFRISNGPRWRKCKRPYGKLGPSCG